MLSTYNRIKLESSKRPDEQQVMYNAIYPVKKKGLEWNQYIGRIIINDFIKQLDEFDGTDFAEYMTVLPYIEYGMFQSAIKIISKINIDGLDNQKQWLLKSLEEGEDRYE